MSLYQIQSRFGQIRDRLLRFFLKSMTVLSLRRSRLVP
jgi:hypothetical protein